MAWEWSSTGSLPSVFVEDWRSPSQTISGTHRRRVSPWTKRKPTLGCKREACLSPWTWGRGRRVLHIPGKGQQMSWQASPSPSPQRSDFRTQVILLDLFVSSSHLWWFIYRIGVFSDEKHSLWDCSQLIPSWYLPFPMMAFCERDGRVLD